jgi:hypothetical protein
VTTYYKKEIMAININSVYKTVLSILNKEQRGYLNPYEYNNIAKQVQLDILEKLFYDYNRFLSIEKAGRINETEADIPRKLQEQLDEFYAFSDITLTNGVGTLPTDIYKVIDVTISSETIEVEKIDKNKLPYLKSSPLTKPSTMFPVYFQRASDIIVEPAFSDGSWTLGDLKMKYIQVPDDPRWGYNVNANYGINVYDSTAFVSGGLRSRTLASTAGEYSESGSYTNNTYTTFTTNGSGTGATITLTVAGNDPTTLVVTAPGSGYAVGDEIRFAQGTVGGSADIVYTIKAGDTFDSSTQGSTNFTLHPSHESELVIGILAYSGFTVKNPEVLQGAIGLAQGTATTKQQQ